MNKNIKWIIALSVCEVANLYTMSKDFVVGIVPFSICLVAIIMNITQLNTKEN